jgi:hypothetical protein
MTINRSDDFGASWSSVSVTGLRNLKMNKTGQYWFYIADTYNAAPGIYVSSDYGVNFTRTHIGTTPDFSSTFPKGAGISSDGRYMYAVIFDAVNNYIHVYRSNDFGVTWAMTSFTAFSYNQDITVPVSDDGRRVIIMDGLSVFSTDDYGATFTEISEFSSGNFGEMAAGISPDGNRFYIGAILNYYYPPYQGLYASTNSGVSWTQPDTTQRGYKTLTTIGATPNVPTGPYNLYLSTKIESAGAPLVYVEKNYRCTLRGNNPGGQFSSVVSLTGSIYQFIGGAWVRWDGDGDNHKGSIFVAYFDAAGVTKLEVSAYSGPSGVGAGTWQLYLYANGSNCYGLRVGVKQVGAYPVRLVVDSAQIANICPVA